MTDWDAEIPQRGSFRDHQRTYELASFEGDVNHTAAAATATLTIAKAAATVTANGGSYIYDGAAHPATATVTGVSGVSIGPLTTHVPSGDLVRGLRRWDLVALVVNSVIGAGIFGLPSRAFAIFLVILCFAEVGSRFSATGGPYLYARVTFGPLIGFQVGWLMWLGRIAAFASLSNLVVGYLGYFIPAASADPWRSVTIVAIISALAITNIVGVRVTTAVTNALPTIAAKPQV